MRFRIDIDSDTGTVTAVTAWAPSDDGESEAGEAVPRAWWPHVARRWGATEDVLGRPVSRPIVFVDGERSDPEPYVARHAQMCLAAEAAPAQ